jgi:DNA mismatch repair protein MutS2
LPLCDDREEAALRMAEVTEMTALLRAGENAPSLGFPEIEPHLDAVEKGVPLGAEELKQVAGLCEAGESVRRYFARYAPERATTGPKAPRLGEIALGLGEHDELVQRARETFDERGELRDTASPELFRLRRERDGLATRAREEIERLLTSEEFEPYLQDRYVTLRQDRFVLPLRASFKSMGLGIVHDTSRTGETVFLEPTRVVELNNRLKVAEIAIRHESRRILEELAAMVADAAPALRQDREILTRLDVVAAKARLSVDYGGEPVELLPGPVVDLLALRHPLLALRPGLAVTANDVPLGAVPGRSAEKVLVVSGPNAGGKTVLLKAVGVAALLARAGMHVPCGSGSRLGFFHDVLADIGDQQSVMSDLSTFSGHLQNVGMILDRVASARPDENVLVLLDELMAGTHPEQGAALARATLETLVAGPGLVITTTHYDSLKALTETDRRFRNAGMEYDLTNLRPTFRLRDGLPGRSYALDIAARMGLPEAVLARARELVGASSLGLEEVLRNLEEREQALTASAAALERAKEDLEERADDQREAAAALARRERELAVRSRDVIDAAVRDARNAIDDIVREVRKTRTKAAADEAKRQLEQKAREATAHLPERPALDVDKLREALAARALGLAPGKGARGGVTAGAASPPPPAAGEDLPPAIQTRSNSVDVRGQRADEALRLVQEFLDQVALDGGDTVFVIHGHGTGALRKAVREYLATSPYVRRFRPGGAGEGGDGVTVVALRG